MEYLRPRTISDALTLFARGGMQIVCGGTDVFARSIESTCSGFIDISAIESLSGIEEVDGWIHVGAATTWANVQHALPNLPSVLKRAAELIGPPQVQYHGTVGGNVCNAAAAADGVPALLCLGSRVQLRSVRGTREVELHAFLKSTRQTIIATDELLTVIKFPRLLVNQGSAFYKVGNRRAVITAVVSAAVKLGWDDKAEVCEAAVVIGAASAVPMRVPSIEQYLLGQKVNELKSFQVPMPELYPISDIRASDTYRIAMANVAVSRACASIEQRHFHE